MNDDATQKTRYQNIDLAFRVLKQSAHAARLTSSPNGRSAPTATPVSPPNAPPAASRSRPSARPTAATVASPSALRPRPDAFGLSF